MLNLTTFSIAARCQRTGMLGVAVSTAVPSVGALCVFVRAGIGAIASQAFVNPYLGLEGLRLLETGHTPDATMDQVLSADPGQSSRQLGIVDNTGKAVAFTGEECVPWAGHTVGDGYSVQGNLLVGESTITAMARSFEASHSEALHDRLMGALEAGQAAGGDSRGRQSAALRVATTEEYPYLELRVDESDDPVAELRRILEVAKVQLLPFVGMLPTRAKPGGEPSDTVIEMMLRPPSDRTPIE